AVGEGAAGKPLGAGLAGSRVFGVLPMPLDPRKTQAVVEGALAESIAKRATADPAANPSPVPRAELSVDAFETQPAAVSARSGRGIRLPLPLLAAVGAAVLALAGAAAWYFPRSSHTTASASAPVATAPAKAPAAAEEPAAATAETPVATPSTETLIVHGKVDELLEKARLAMKERRFTEPG